MTRKEFVESVFYAWVYEGRALVKRRRTEAPSFFLFCVSVPSYHIMRFSISMGLENNNRKFML